MCRTHLTVQKKPWERKREERGFGRRINRECVEDAKAVGRKEDQGCQEPGARSPDWRTNVSEGEAQDLPGNQQSSEGRDLHESKVLIRGRPAQSSPEWEHRTQRSTIFSIFTPSHLHSGMGLG